MTTLHLLLIAIIQGITEFLPVSSSGHLILLPSLTGMADQGQMIDVAAHVGTLCAVMLYFWRDVELALGGTLRLLRGKIDTQGAFLALCLIIATIPVILVRADPETDRPVRCNARHRGDRLDDDDFRHLPVLGRPERRRSKRQPTNWTAQRRSQNGSLAGRRPDPRHIAVGHHNHGRADAGLYTHRRGTPVYADVDPDDHRIRRPCWVWMS